jgi:hypothetical protein
MPITYFKLNAVALKSRNHGVDAYKIFDNSKILGMYPLLSPPFTFHFISTSFYNCDLNNSGIKKYIVKILFFY